jgi:hypothetical protein
VRAQFGRDGGALVRVTGAEIDGVPGGDQAARRLVSQPAGGSGDERRRHGSSLPDPSDRE